MINIIEHFWQFEVTDCKIVPTVIKISQEPPKAYFYSQKQNRVLRKKQHSIQSSIDVLKNKQTAGQAEFLIFTRVSNHILHPSLAVSSQLYDLLSQPGGDRVIFNVEGEVSITYLFQCSLNLQTNQFSTDILAQKDKATKIWSPGKDAVSAGLEELLKKETMRINKKLHEKLKTAEQCQLFSIIVATDTEQSSFRCLWCNQLKWKQPLFYQISYSLETLKKKKVEQIGPIQKAIEPSAFKIDQFHREDSRSKIKQPLKDDICKGCNKVASAMEKEVANEDIIQLRRAHKLSILGLTQEYYLVCQECYQAL